MSLHPELEYKRIAPAIRDYLASRGFKHLDVQFVGSAGSQRVYYRLKQGLVSYILLHSPPEDRDFHRFLRLTQFYRLLHFPVPQTYCIDEESMQVLLEDLGDVRLYDVVKTSRKQSLPLYSQTLQVLIDMQTRCTQQYGECPDIGSRIFDAGQLLWETDYFTREYLLDYRGLVFSASAGNALKKELHHLARRVDRQPKTIMHRDFQSQNLMVQHQQIRVIDYQGSRLGSLYYDLASLLLDPYVMLSDTAIRDLFQVYASRSTLSLSLEEAYQEFLYAGLQRIMQANGAFCFLSRKKNLKSFSKYIAPGITRLRWILKQVHMPVLSDLVQ